MTTEVVLIRAAQGRVPVRAVRRRRKVVMEAQRQRTVANYQVSVISPGLSDFKEAEI